jgi:hypothetical protein
MLTDQSISITHWQDHTDALLQVLQLIVRLAPVTDEEGQFPEQARHPSML